MGGLTVGMENHGNDNFIYWMADCKNYEGRQDIFSFDQGELNFFSIFYPLVLVRNEFG